MLDDEYYTEGWTEGSLLDLQLQVECEFPNSNLHNFRGRVGVSHPQASTRKEKIMPIQMSQMLLRGCMLKNSHYVYGLVIYTGSETRIQMNSAAPPLKIGGFDHFLNIQVAILICGQLVLCLICAILNYSWRETEACFSVCCGVFSPPGAVVSFRLPAISKLRCTHLSLGSNFEFTRLRVRRTAQCWSQVCIRQRQVRLHMTPLLEQQRTQHLTVASGSVQGKQRYYLAFDFYVEGNNENGFVYTLLVFITFWILYSYLVPISLFVTLEIVKFWQGFVFINADPEMRDAGAEGAKCRNSNLNEDLGKIDYIFSDKTGTLTSNEMRLRLVAIKGQPLGDLNRNLESQPHLRGMAALKFFSGTMHDGLQARASLACMLGFRGNVACGAMGLCVHAFMLYLN